MPFFGLPIRNGLPIGLGSVAGFGVQQFDPSQLFAGGTVAGAWYDPSDLSTLFTTSAGTTPVAMPGQGSPVPVGLMLDKSQNGVGTNGAYRYNLLTYSQAFGNAAWVTASATKVSTTQTDPNGGSTAALITIASGGEFYQDVTLTGGSGSFSVYVKKPATGGATAIRLTTNNRVAWNTGLSTKVTLTSDWQRVVLSGALVSSGSFLRVDITCRDATSAIDTDCIGDVLVAFAQLETSLTASTYQHIDATWYGAIPGNHAIAFNDTTARPELRARVNLLVATATLSTQSVTTQATSYTLSFAGTGSITLSGTATGTYSAGTNTITCTAGTLTLTVSGTVTTADLRPANSGALLPAYQAVVDANTYDTSGFPLYLRFDGIDDSMYTPANLNLSGTDKVSVFAGVRRNATATAFPVEFSAQSDATNSTFGIGSDSGGAEYFFNSRGTTLRQVSIDNAAYNAPVSNVVTLSADIAAPSLVARLNGTQVGSNTSSQGTGNFGTYPLYIGSRANASFFLNGHLHSLIIAGSAVNAGNISATEQWVAQRTGIVIP